jgi:hypothetical protein
MAKIDSRCPKLPPGRISIVQITKCLGKEKLAEFEREAAREGKSK